MRFVRYLRPFLALQEFWLVLVLTLLLSLLKAVVPAGFTASLGWTIHPYQVFAVCTALAGFMLPGALVVRLLGVGGSWLTRLPLYFATAVGVWTLPTLWVAFSKRYAIEHLMLMGVVLVALLALAVYLRELLHPSDPDPVVDEGRTDPGEPLNPLLVGLVIAVFLAMVYLSFTAPVALDDNLQLMYVQDDLVMPHINEYEPVFGAGISPQTRGSLTTWPLNLTVITYLTGLPAQQAFWLLRTPLAVLDLLAVYAISLRLFGKRNLALFCVAFYFLLTLIYTNDADGIGFGFYARTAQDKFVARYAMFPMALAWSMAYLKMRDWRAYWLAGVCTFGLATTHPIGVVLLGIPLGGMGLMHLFNHFSLGSFAELRRPGEWLRAVWQRNWPVLRPLALLAVFSLISVAVPLLQQASPDAPIVAYSLTDTRDPTLWFRVNLAVNAHRLYIDESLGTEAYIVHPSVFADAYMLIPALGLPVLFIFWRKRWVSELMIGTFLLNPALLLIPPVIQLIGSRATPWLLYRFAWPLSLLGPLAMAWAVWSLCEALRWRFPSRWLHTALPVAVLLLSAALLNQEIKRGLTILSEQQADSISARCRALQPLFSRLPELVGDGSVVLATPEDNLCMVASSAYAYPVEFGLTTTINRFPASRVDESIQRLNDVLAFIYAEVIDQDLMNILTRWNVGLILLRADHPLIAQLEGMPHFFSLELVEDRYKVFRVNPGIGTDGLQYLSKTERWKAAYWREQDALVSANTAWSEERWGDAIVAYEAIARKNGAPGELDLTGLGRAQLSAGKLDEALASFAQAAASYPDSVQAWMLLGSLRLAESDYQGMADAYHQVLRLIDWHPQALTRLADAYRLQGQADIAYVLYERAVASNTTPATSLYYRALGSLFLEINWNSEALAALERSLEIRESLLAYQLVSQVHLNENDLEQAAEAAFDARKLDFWSDVSSIILGKIELFKLDFAAALEHFQVALDNNPQSNGISYLTSTLGNLQGHQAALDAVRELVGYQLGFAGPVLAAAQEQFALGLLDEALESGETAFAWKPVDPQAADFLGSVHLAIGSWEHAHDYFATALLLSPTDHAAYAGLTSLAQMEGQTDAALGWAWSSLIATPYNADTWVELGLVSEVRGETAEAFNSYQLAIQTGPNNPRAYITLGEFQSSQAQYGAAVQSFNQSVALKPDSTSAYRDLADASQMIGLFPVSLQLASGAVQLHPAEGANRISVSERLIQGGNPSGAIYDLGQAVVLDPGYREAYLLLASLHEDLGMTSEAEAVYRQLIQVMPFYEDGYLGLGRLYERQGQPDQALAVYQDAMTRISGHVAGYVTLSMADLLRRQGDFDQAERLYQRCIDQQPMLAAAYSALSAFYVARGDLSSARSVLDQGLALLPTALVLNQAVGELLILQGEDEQAGAFYEHLMAVSPDPQLALLSARLSAAQGQPETALAQLDSARQTWAGATRVLLAGSSLALQLGQPVEALQMAVDLVSVAPGYASSWMALGQAYAANADFDRAELAFRKAATQAPGDSAAQLALGSFLASRGQSEQAEQAFDAAVSADHTNISPHLELAALLIRQGQLPAAVSELQMAAALDVTQAAALLELGQLEQQTGDLSRALGYFQQALAASPLDPATYQAQAQVYLIQGQAHAAYRALTTATQVSAGDCRAHIYLADYLAAHGQYGEARQSYQVALENAGCQGAAHLGLGNLYQIQGQADQASAEYLQTIEAEPGNWLGYATTARYFTLRAKRLDAAAITQRGIAALPASAPLRIADSSSLSGEGKLDEGLSVAQESVRLAPGTASYIALGNAYQALGQVEQARSSFVRAAQADRSDASPFLSLGHLSVSMAQFDQAEAAYYQALEIAPIQPRGYISLGDLSLRRGQIEQALELYTQGMAVDQGQQDARLAQIQVYLRLGRLEEAAEAIALAFETPSSDELPFQAESTAPDQALESETASLWVALGDLFRLKADWPSAEAAYQQAIHTAPGLPAPYLSLGEAYQVQGKYAEARTQYVQIIALTPGNAEGSIALGELSAIQGDYAAAEQAFLLAAAASPGEVQANLHLGSLYRTQGKGAEARAQLELATRLAPTDAESWVALGDWYASQADRAQARQAYRHAIIANPADPVGYVAMGDYYQDGGLRGAALDQLQAAVTIAPFSLESHLALAGWYELEANWAAAESSYLQAVAVDAGDTNAWLGLGYVYLAEDEPSASYSSFQAAIRLYPANNRAYQGMGDWYSRNINEEASRQIAEDELAKAHRQFKDAEMKQKPNEFIEFLVTGMQDLQKGNVDEAYANFDAAIEADPESMLPYLAMGEWYYAAAGLGSAEHAYQSAIDLAPGDIQGNLHLGQLYQRTDRSLQALAQYQLAVQVAPGLAQSHINLADWYAAQGNLSAAEAEYLAGIVAEPGELTSYLKLAETYDLQGRHAEAVALLEVAVEAGVPSLLSVCAPGQLPSPTSGLEAVEVYSPYDLLAHSWFCQWEMRPWAASTRIEAQ